MYIVHTGKLYRSRKSVDLNFEVIGHGQVKSAVDYIAK